MGKVAVHSVTSDGTRLSQVTVQLNHNIKEGVEISTRVQEALE